MAAHLTRHWLNDCQSTFFDCHFALGRIDWFGGSLLDLIQWKDDDRRLPVEWKWTSSFKGLGLTAVSTSSLHTFSSFLLVRLVGRSVSTNVDGTSATAIAARKRFRLPPCCTNENRENEGMEKRKKGKNKTKSYRKLEKRKERNLDRDRNRDRD